MLGKGKYELLWQPYLIEECPEASGGKMTLKLTSENRVGIIAQGITVSTDTIDAQ